MEMLHKVLCARPQTLLYALHRIIHTYTLWRIQAEKESMIQLASSTTQIGNIIKPERRAADLTQQDLAEQVGSDKRPYLMSRLLDLLAALDLELTIAPRSGGTLVAPQASSDGPSARAHCRERPSQ